MFDIYMLFDIYMNVQFKSVESAERRHFIKKKDTKFFIEKSHTTFFILFDVDF